MSRVACWALTRVALEAGMNLDLSPGVYDSAAARHALYKRSLTIVVCSQIFGGAGLAAGVTVGGLLAQQMLGGDAAAGVPAMLFTLGSALTAFGIGRLTQ